MRKKSVIKESKVCETLSEYKVDRFAKYKVVTKKGKDGWYVVNV